MFTQLFAHLSHLPITLKYHWEILISPNHSRQRTRIYSRLITRINFQLFNPMFRFHIERTSSLAQKWRQGFARIHLLCIRSQFEFKFLISSTTVRKLIRLVQLANLRVDLPTCNFQVPHAWILFQLHIDHRKPWTYRCENFPPSWSMKPSERVRRVVS